MKLSQQLWFPGGVLLLGAASLHPWAVGLSAVEPFLTAFCLWLLPALYAANGATHWRLQTLALLLPLDVVLFSHLPDQS